VNVIKIIVKEKNSIPWMLDYERIPGSTRK